MTDTAMQLPAEVQEALDVLVENLLCAEPIMAYRQAQSRLDASGQARALLHRLSGAQAEIRLRQARSEVTPADIEKVRALQREAQGNAIIRAYGEAQQVAIAYLPYPR